MGEECRCFKALLKLTMELVSREAFVLEDSELPAVVVACWMSLDVPSQVTKIDYALCITSFRSLWSGSGRITLFQ
jgi:hypothetical protein